MLYRSNTVATVGQTQIARCEYATLVGDTERRSDGRFRSNSDVIREYVKTGERSKPPSVRPGIRLSVRAVRGEAAGRSGYHGADLHR